MAYPSPSSGPGGGGSWHPQPPGHGVPQPRHPYSQPQPPYGQDAYGQPRYGHESYGQPPYSHPPYGQPPYGQQQPRTNGFAIAALVSGLAAPLGLFILPVVFALLAFRQIRQYGQRGVDLAIGGLVATGVWLLLAGAGVMVATSLERDPDPPPPVPTVDATPPVTSAPPETTPPAPTAEPEQVSANSLVPGDCVQDLDDDDETVSGLPVVPCDTLHEAEVFATFDIPDGDWPGQETVTSQSHEGCADRLAADYPEADRDPSTVVYSLFPTEQSWAGGDRKVICMAYYRDGARRGSIVN